MALGESSPRQTQPATERYLPLAIDVSGWRCLVVGGGRIGTRKALTLARAGADVRVVAMEIAETTQDDLTRAGVTLLLEAYHPRHLESVRFVVAATSDATLNLRIAEEAEARGILHSVAFPGRNSRAIFPAVHRQNGLTVAIHSDGRDCAASTQLRDDIAGILHRRRPAALQLALFGVRRESIPEEAFALISEKAGTGAALGSEAPAVLLATCNRWEVYAAVASPPAFCRHIRARLHALTGLVPEAHGDAFYAKSGAAAFHHLLRVASGLDSPLRGETEVLGQVRQALAESQADPAGELGKIFAEALRLQGDVRSAAPSQRAGWVDGGTDALRQRLHSLAGKRILLVGCGRLGEALAKRLTGEGATVLPFSRRAAAGVEWCRAQHLPIYAPDDIGAHFSDADALILTAPLPASAQRAAESQFARFPRPVLDFTDRAGEAVRKLPSYLRVSAGDRPPRNGAELAEIYQAERGAVTAALTWHRNSSGIAPDRLRILSRQSQLAKAQVDEVSEFLRALAPKLEIAPIFLETPGDRDKTTPLPEVRQEDFFTADLDRALLAGEADVAVHSAKDLPRRLPDGLAVAALTPAFIPWEALLTRDGTPLARLPSGSRIGTSSARRHERLLALRPDIQPAAIRGNVPDRVAQLDAGRYDGLILAATGLVRLGLAGRITQLFSHDEFAPEPGQGSLALVVRAREAELIRFLQPLDLGDRSQLPWA